jgi:hypothetical protein
LRTGSIGFSAGSWAWQQEAISTATKKKLGNFRNLIIEGFSGDWLIQPVAAHKMLKNNQLQRFALAIGDKIMQAGGQPNIKTIRNVSQELLILPYHITGSCAMRLHKY